MNSNGDKIPVDQQHNQSLPEQKIALLEKQLACEKLRADAANLKPGTLAMLPATWQT
jgi:hypothetical protein